MGEPQKDPPQGELVALGLLSMAAGGMDSLAFLKLGEVFTSAMSGNTILFGLAVGGGRLLAASHSMVAFAGYVAGVVAAVPILRRPGTPVTRVLAIEAAFLAAFALLWSLSRAPGEPPAVFALILLSAVAMGSQAAAARHLQVPGIMTIVFTNTLTTIVATIADRALGRQHPIIAPPTWRQIAMFLVYLGSAVITALLFRYRPATPPFVPLLCLLLVLIGLRAGRFRL